jgi:hypothetical protein
MTSNESYPVAEEPADDEPVDVELVDVEPVDVEPVDNEPVDNDSVETSAPASGDPRVDAAMQRARELAGTSPTEHVEIYEDVHRSLQEVLADASGQPPATELPDPHAGDAVR